MKQNQSFQRAQPLGLGRASLNVRVGGKIESNKGRAMRASLLWSMFQGVACSTGHAFVCTEVAQNLHRDPHRSSFPKNKKKKQKKNNNPRKVCASRWHALLLGIMTTWLSPHSPGFWHCAHKHDSQDKRQAKRFCKPFMKHNEVFMEHIILKGTIAGSPWCTLRRDEKIQLLSEIGRDPLLSFQRAFHSSVTHFLPMRK